MQILIVLVLISLAGLNIGVFFFSVEFIVVISLLLFFYVLIFQFGNLVSKYFFSKIEYIYFFFFELISINLLLAKLLFKILNDVVKFQFIIFNILENRVFFFKILYLNSLVDIRNFACMLNSLLFNFYFIIFFNEMKFLNKFHFDLDIEYVLCIKYYYFQGLENNNI
jgi:hypothetical protein